MGEWLGDTVEAAEHVTGLVERARAAPKEVMRELHGYALGLSDETGAFMRAMGVKSNAQIIGAGVGSTAAALSRGRGAAPLPPSSNTGGKVIPDRGRKQGGRTR